MESGPERLNDFAKADKARQRELDNQDRELAKQPHETLSSFMEAEQRREAAAEKRAGKPNNGFAAMRAKHRLITWAWNVAPLMQDLHGDAPQPTLPPKPKSKPKPKPKRVSRKSPGAKLKKPAKRKRVKASR